MRRAIKFQLLALIAMLVLVIAFSGILTATGEDPGTVGQAQVTESVPGGETPAGDAGETVTEEAAPPADEPPAPDPGAPGVEEGSDPPERGEAPAPTDGEKDEPAGDETTGKKRDEAPETPLKEAASRIAGAVSPQGVAAQTAPSMPQPQGGDVGVIETLIWEDENGNGVKDETPVNYLDGVTVNLYRLDNGTPVFFSSKVSGSGGYPNPYLPFLPPVTYDHGWVGWNQLPTSWGADLFVHYQVELVVPEGYCATSGTVKNTTLRPTCLWEGFLDGFSLKRCPELDGYKFIDLNENGQMDPGEQGLPGVTIVLDDGADSAVTDGDGYFKFFTTVGEHTVAVDESTAPGYYPTTPTSFIVNVTEEGVDPVYFGNAPFGSISGRKWEDLDGDGELTEGDLPLGGVTIRLEGTTTSGDPVTLETTTAEDGTYSFTDLRGGVYIVSEVVPDGMTPTSPTSIDVTLTPGENITDRDFFNRVSAGLLEGYKFADLDEDGTMDEGEEGMEGVTVILDDDADTAVTDEDGYFSFIVQPGAHTVAVDESTAPGYYPTTPTSVDVEVPLDGTETVYFGNAPLAGIVGRKWEDANLNGTLDSGDVPVAGWTITLIGETNVGGEQVALETLTGADGSFSFEGLKAGSYNVSELVPAGWDAVTDPSLNVVLNPGETLNGVEFLNVQAAGTPEPPPPPTPPTAPPPGEPTPAPTGQLPFTGMNQVPWRVGAGLAMLLGLGLMSAGFARRRRAA